MSESADIDFNPSADATEFFPQGDDSNAWQPRFYVSSDYVLGWLRGSILPPLVTTSPAGTARASAGVLGQPGTSVLFGNQRVNQDARSGYRLGLGGWFDERRTMGIDAGFLVLESQNSVFFANSAGNPILARPFFDVLTNKLSSQLVAFPGTSRGSITAFDRSNNLYGAHLDLQEAMFTGDNFRLVGLLGYRFLRLDDSLGVQQDLVSTSSGGIIVPGTRIQTVDRFNTENEFHGIDMGMRGELWWQQWSLNLLAKVAVGNLRRQADIAGSTLVTVPGSAPLLSQGGMLALASNIGQHTTRDWIAVPELGATLGWNITQNLRFQIGYSVLFWSNIARASDQVSLSLNPNLFPPSQSGGPRNPAFEFHKSDMWVQTVNFGLQFRY
jgi:hypothetical protein